MILDGDLRFNAATGQTLTATAASTSVLDQQAAGGAIDNMWLVTKVYTALDSTEEDATLTIALESDSASDFSTNSTKIVHGATAALTEAACATGHTVLWKFKLPANLQRYVRVYYTVGSHNFTTGSVDSFLVKDINQWIV